MPLQTLQGDWHAELWPEGQMVVFALPFPTMATG